MSSSDLSHTADSNGTTAADHIIRNTFRTVAIVEMFTWVGILTAITLRNWVTGDRLGVTVWGWAHGVTWLVFVAACLVAGFWFRWRLWVIVAGLAMSTLPFLTWPFEIWMQRSGRLDARAPRTNSALGVSRLAGTGESCGD